MAEGADDLWGDGFGRFVADHWQRSPALLEVAKDPVADMGLDDVEEIIATGPPAKDIRAVREEGGELRSQPCPTRHDSDRVDQFALFHLYANGWTIIANSVDRASGRLAALSAGISDALDVHVNINLYLTPSGSQGFLPHVDGHDVLILPVVGEKAWEIYDCPIELPLEHQETPPLEDDTPSTVHQVGPGSMLYMPRGYRHRAWSGGHACAHLTVGLHPVRAIELVEALVRSVAERDVRLRVGLPRSEALAVGRQELADLGRVLVDLDDDVAHEVVADVRRSVERRVLRHTTFAPGTTLSAIECVESVTADTVLRHRSGQVPIVAVDHEADQATLTVSDSTITMPAWVAPALRYVAEHDVLTPRQLPELSESSALVRSRGEALGR